MTIRHLLLATIGFVVVLAGPAAAAPLVDADWLQSRLGSKGLVVLDIRNKIDGGSREAFETGHIPGAVYSNYLTDGWRTEREGVPGMLPPMADLERLIGGVGIDGDSHVVIVPAGVSALDYGSATRVYWTFKVLGHDAVSILNGGYKGWAADPSRPVETGPTQPTPVAFKADFRPQYLATKEDVRAALTGDVALVDNRPPEQFSGAKKHPKAARAGTIPGSVNIPQDQFFDEKSGGFVDLERISKLWQGENVSETGEQIAFCNTGHWASLGWFAASEILGNTRAKMYDGSMTEWTADAALPVAPGTPGS